MEPESRQRDVTHLCATADRLDALADTAELMGDAAGAERWRAEAAGRRQRAFELLDD